MGVWGSGACGSGSRQTRNPVNPSLFTVAGFGFRVSVPDFGFRVPDSIVECRGQAMGGPVWNSFHVATTLGDEREGRGQGCRAMRRLDEVTFDVVQGYLAHKKHSPCRTLQ